MTPFSTGKIGTAQRQARIDELVAEIEALGGSVDIPAFRQGQVGSKAFNDRISIAQAELAALKGSALDDGVLYQGQVGSASLNKVVDSINDGVDTVESYELDIPDAIERAAVTEGNNLTLSVAITSNPTPTIIWEYYDGEDWVAITEAVETLWTGVSGVGTDELVLEGVGIALDGVGIRVRATWTVGTRTDTVTSDLATISVIAAESELEQLVIVASGAEMADGDQFVLSTDGVNPAYSWEFDDNSSVTEGFTRVGIGFIGLWGTLTALVNAINNATDLPFTAEFDGNVTIVLTAVEAGTPAALSVLQPPTTVKLSQTGSWG